jgi:hypothetical protein
MVDIYKSENEAENSLYGIFKKAFGVSDEQLEVIRANKERMRFEKDNRSIRRMENKISSKMDKQLPIGDRIRKDLSLSSDEKDVLKMGTTAIGALGAVVVAGVGAGVALTGTVSGSILALGALGAALPAFGVAAVGVSVAASVVGVALKTPSYIYDHFKHKVEDKKEPLVENTSYLKAVKKFNDSDNLLHETIAKKNVDIVKEGNGTRIGIEDVKISKEDFDGSYLQKIKDRFPDKFNVGDFKGEVVLPDRVILRGIENPINLKSIISPSDSIPSGVSFKGNSPRGIAKLAIEEQKIKKQQVNRLGK